MTLKELWEEQGLSPTQLAAQADISTATLYKMYRKEKVSSRSIANVCRVLKITKQQYDRLSASADT